MIVEYELINILKRKACLFFVQVLLIIAIYLSGKQNWTTNLVLKKLKTKIILLDSNGKSIVFNNYLGEVLSRFWLKIFRIKITMSLRVWFFSSNVVDQSCFVYHLLNFGKCFSLIRQYSSTILQGSGSYIELTFENFLILSSFYTF